MCASKLPCADEKLGCVRKHVFGTRIYDSQRCIHNRNVEQWQRRNRRIQL
jgi:hypothetical protein